MENALKQISRFFEKTETDDDGQVRAYIFSSNPNPVISNMSIEEKRNAALSLGVPAPGSGVVGEWNDERDPDRVVVVPFTDESLDTYNTAFDSAGWDFRRYQKNPAVFFSHESDRMPVGLALKLEPADIKGKDGRERAGWKAHVLLSSAELNADADAVYRNWVAGRFRGSSVGFRPSKVEPATEEDRQRMGLPEDDEAWVIREAELLEISLVPVPSNASAVARTIEEREEEVDATSQELRDILSEVKELVAEVKEQVADIHQVPHSESWTASTEAQEPSYIAEILDLSKQFKNTD